MDSEDKSANLRELVGLKFGYSHFDDFEGYSLKLIGILQIGFVFVFVWTCKMCM